MENNIVDVQKIMEEIKAEIAAKGLANDIPAFEDTVSLGCGSNASVDLSALKRELAYLRQHEVHYYRDITSYHPWLTPIVRFVKRVIRKLCKFLGEPMVEEVNEYHRHVAKTIEHIIKALEQQPNLTAMSEDPLENRVLEARKYKQLAEQYATQCFRTEKLLESYNTLKSSVASSEDKAKVLALNIERLELQLEILKLQVEKDK